MKDILLLLNQINLTGLQRKKIVSFINRYSLEDLISLKSFVNYQQLEKEYQQGDIFILPSHQTRTWEEQYGMVLLEALSSGIPIITTKSGSIQNVVPEHTLLVSPGNFIELYKTRDVSIK